jgi:hypothetical protein
LQDVKKVIARLTLLCLLPISVVWLTLRHTGISLPLPIEEDIAGVSCCTTDGEYVLLTNDSHTGKQHARLFNSRDHRFRDLLSADRINAVRISPARKLIAISAYTKNSQRPASLQIFSESGEKHGAIEHPNGYYFDPLWDATSKKIFFQMVRPEISEDETGGMVYTDVGVLDVASMQVHSIPLKTFPSYLSYCPRDDRLYASGAINENASDNVVDVIDVSSERLVESRKDFRGTIFSTNCTYYVPELHEGGLPWEIYERAGNSQLRQFANASGDVAEQFGGWHPKIDNVYVLIDTSAEPQTLSVFDVRQKKALARIEIFDRDDWHDYTWSADGKSLIFPVGRHLEIHRIFP